MKPASERRLGFQEARVVNDFNTLDDLIAHAHHELGATHTSGSDAHTKIYFPRGGQHPYEEATVWRKSGYWHAQGPGARTGVARLPAGARPIGGHARRAAERTVRDYIAIDRRGRTIAGPSKSYSDMKQAAGTAGVVKYVRPGMGEARRGASGNPEIAGERYAEKKIKSTHFDDWVRDQLIEAQSMPADQVLPLETPEDARKIARRMLQQLEWDTKHGLTMDRAEQATGIKIDDEAAFEAFYKGFHKELMDAVPWLADELLTLNRELRGATEARRRPKAKRSVRKKRPTKR